MKKALKKSKEKDAPIENLSIIFSPEERKAIIEKIFRNRIELIGYGDREIMSIRQKERIEEIKSNYKFDEEAINLCEQKRNATQNKISEFNEQLEKIKKSIAEQKQQLEKYNKTYEHFQKTMKKKKEALEELENCMNEIKTIVLVHPTANIGELAHYSFSMIYVTKQDRSVFKDLKPDDIFEYSEENKLIFLPQYYSYLLGEKYDDDAKRSILDYCEMVAHVKKNEDKNVNVVTLFHNEDIANILKVNGIGE